MQFEVPSQCGTEADFRRQLAELAGSSVRQLAPSLLQIREEGAGRFRLHLEIQGEEREIVDPDCATLLRTAVGLVGLSGFSGI